jgi:hypothetical integral membrane protein (TIGR02206 family)
MNSERAFQAFGPDHLVAIFLTLASPFVLAAIARRSGSRLLDRSIIGGLSGILIFNYIGYLVFIRRSSELAWHQMLPMQMCDWAVAVIIVTLWTANHRWFEVAYFWGLGGTLQAVLTPDLRFGFPDVRFISFFVAHGVIIVAVGYLMLTRRLRPYPISVVRVFLWSEVYFVLAMIVNHFSGMNYGYLSRKPEAFSLLSYLSDSWPLYLLQMHGLALVFFALLYAPWAVYDSVWRRRHVGSAEPI